MRPKDSNITWGMLRSGERCPPSRFPTYNLNHPTTYCLYLTVSPLTYQPYAPRDGTAAGPAHQPLPPRICRRRGLHGLPALWAAAGCQDPGGVGWQRETGINCHPLSGGGGIGLMWCGVVPVREDLTSHSIRWAIAG